jgi:Holliday junction resolvasome RuvABC DNA-binding subunit
VKSLATATDYLLALATLGYTTKIINNPISSVTPHKVAKASKEGTISQAISC